MVSSVERLRVNRFDQSPRWKKILICLLPTILLLSGMEIAGRLLPKEWIQFELIQRTPPVGLGLAPNWEGASHGAWIKVNRQGFRMNEEIPSDKMSREFRIIVVGDSRAFGFGVENDETYSSRLQQLLRSEFPDRKITVLNAAVPGFTSREALRFVQLKAFEYHPDLLIVTVGHNDRWVNEREPLEQISPAIVQPRTSRPGIGFGIFTFLQWSTQPIRHRLNMFPPYENAKNSFANWLQDVFGKPPPKRSWDGVFFDHTVPIEEFRANLFTLTNLSKERNVPVILVSLEENPGVFLHGERGIELYNQEEFDAATGEFNRVIALADISPVPYYYLGLMAQKRGSEDVAAADFLLAEMCAEYFPLFGIKKTVVYWQATGRTLKSTRTVTELAQTPAIADPRYLTREYSAETLSLADDSNVFSLIIDASVMDESMFFVGDADHPSVEGHRVIADELYNLLLSKKLIF